MPATQESSSAAAPTLPTRAYRCDCGAPLFFRNSHCLQCDRPLGYDSDCARLLTLVPGPAEGLWYAAGEPEHVLYRRCDNIDTAAACNWLVVVDDSDPPSDSPCLCAACRLNRVIPDLSVPDNAILWGRIELAKRRLVSALITLGLPVASRVGEDPERGLAFDFLQSPPEGPPVVTGHDEGIITIDIDEADDALREQRRAALRESYRTLLGHLRHETGHYYWYRLVQHDPAWLEGFRLIFGDERSDYAECLQTYYNLGCQPDWATRYVSAYASSHPWEDWAETWAHYLHMVDAVGTAQSFGLHDDKLAIEAAPFLPDTLQDESDLGRDDVNEDARQAETNSFLDLVNTWVRLTAVMNELSRSMGQADFYPFVLSPTAVRKLFFVHRLVVATSTGSITDTTPAAAVESQAAVPQAIAHAA
ncbi:MAG: putative zinc-binding metallopeptidase [Moraxellaceae bacterium]|nr:putative zinc-binding metallopeptidase [Moraxellaceae bacterium]